MLMHHVQFLRFTKVHSDTLIRTSTSPQSENHLKILSAEIPKRLDAAP